MFTCVSKLLAAVRNLTDSLLTLSATVRQLNDGILAAQAGEDTPPVLDHKPDAEALPHKRNGRKVAAE